jgi:uncharacterized membrane protein
MTRIAAVALGVVGLVVYAFLMVRNGHGVVPMVTGAALGIVVLLLLARQR